MHYEDWLWEQQYLQDEAQRQQDEQYWVEYWREWRYWAAKCVEKFESVYVGNGV